MNAHAIIEPALDWRETYLRLRPKIERALKVGDHTHSYIDLAMAIEEGRFKCFFCRDAILLVEEAQFPQFKTCTFFMTAGRLASVLKLEEHALQWAKERGCKAATLCGRRGWKRVLEKRGWRLSEKIDMVKEIV